MKIQRRMKKKGDKEGLCRKKGKLKENRDQRK